MAANPNTNFTAGSVYTADQANRFPRGVMGYVQNNTSNATVTGTEADVSGMTVTFTAEANRLYRVTFNCFYLQSDASSRLILVFADSANTAINATQQVNPVASGYGTLSYSYLFGLSSGGSITRKIRAQTTGGTVTIFGSATSTYSLVIEDMGPS